MFRSEVQPQHEACEQQSEPDPQQVVQQDAFCGWLAVAATAAADIASMRETIPKIFFMEISLSI